MAGRLARSRPVDDDRSIRSRKRRRYEKSLGTSRNEATSDSSWEDDDHERHDGQENKYSVVQAWRRRRRGGETGRESRKLQHHQHARSISPVKRTRASQLRDRLPILEGRDLFQSTKILENVSNRQSRPRQGRASTKEALIRMKRQTKELETRSSDSEDPVDEASDFDPMPVDEDDALIWEADAAHLRRLKKADLVRLHEAVSPADIEELNKEAIVESIIALRERVQHGQRGSEAESPVSSRPITSHESSPHSRSRQFGARTRSSKTKKERDARRAHVPTPPASESDSLDSLTALGTDLRLTSPQQSRSRTNGAKSEQGRHGKASANDRVAAGPTPVAFRTRRHLHGSDKKRRPSRRAKVAAVAKIHVDTQIDAADSDPPSRDQSEPPSSNESGWHDTASDTSENVRMQDDSHQRLRRRRGRTSSNARPPSAPSDADEESGGEEEQEDEEEDPEDDDDEVVEHRQLRNGKNVPIRRSSRSSNEGVDDSQDAQDDDEEMSVDGSDVETVDDVNLALATSKTLLRFTRDELLHLCETRHIDGHGTKRELVKALLEWRDRDFDASSAVESPRSSTSHTSTQTTRALERDEPTSKPSSRSTPLLMRRDHSASPEKPVTPDRSKAAEQEEVNALDLESLQLQDKEIPPEKLVKLEKVGSGGFKDVYKGTYRKKIIAIADIRGHLTDMDIKELGLLRDLRHPNIVHFIGVSIPKEPSSVPVMIVTELCANGDLFDYIRAVPHPPFINMLEIMQGIAKGVEYLHTRKPAIIHRDIKSSNVLITAQGIAKINDFGLARVKNTTISKVRSVVGTVHWQAPELWSPKPRYSEKVDVYSCAMVFWEVLQWHQAVKRYPFEGMNDHAIYEAVGQRNLRPSTASLSRTWGLEIMDVVTAMWNGDPNARPPMSQVVLELEVLITAEKAKMKEKSRHAR